MQYRKLGRTGIDVSVIGLGGHEFGPNDKIRGFGDDAKLAVTRGHVFSGFGGENRRAIVHKALDLGINLFDLTIDSEKEAMGRLLRDLGGAEEVLIQTRPEGMVYTYDENNRQMADFSLLKTEVERICSLIGRDHIDILNFAFMKDALDADSEYMGKIGHNIAELKRAGLIRFASADTFSGSATYRAQYESGFFDTTFLNYNVVDAYMDDAVIGPAVRHGIGVLVREPFRKARLFAMAEEAGMQDRSEVARACLKWIARNERVSCVVVGVASAEQLEQNVRAIESGALEPGEAAIIEAISATEAFAREHAERRRGVTGV